MSIILVKLIPVNYGDPSCADTFQLSYLIPAYCRFFLEKLGLMASTDVVSQVMEQLDGNANGEISWEEFWAWWQVRTA